MNSDQRLTLFVALAAGLTLGAAIAGGLRINRVLRNRRQEDKHEHHHLDQWEGEGGNVPSVPTPVPAATLASNG